MAKELERRMQEAAKALDLRQRNFVTGCYNLVEGAFMKNPSLQRKIRLLCKHKLLRAVN